MNCIPSSVRLTVACVLCLKLFVFHSTALPLGDSLDSEEHRDGLAGEIAFDRNVEDFQTKVLNDLKDLSKLALVDSPHNDKRTRFHAWGGKRDAEQNEMHGTEKRKFSPWGGKRSTLPDYLKEMLGYIAMQRHGNQALLDKRRFSPWGGK